MTVLLPRKDLPADFREDEDRASVFRAGVVECRTVWDVVDAQMTAGGDGLSLVVLLERVIRRDPGMTVRMFADCVASLRTRGYLEIGRGPGYRVRRVAEKPDGPRMFAEPRTAGEISRRDAEALESAPDGDELESDWVETRDGPVPVEEPILALKRVDADAPEETEVLEVQAISGGEGSWEIRVDENEVTEILDRTADSRERDDDGKVL